MNVLWVSYGEDGKIKSSGVSELSLRVSNNPTGIPLVAIGESQFNATGNTCRSSAWIACFVASQEAGKQLSDYEFLYGMGKELVDGPSAGMTFAATGLTVLENRPLREEKTALTGAINPDGTIGPVGGVRHKLDGAIRDGVKFFGYPIGARLEYDPVKDQFYDIEEIARKAGVTAVELADINDAVNLLTGVTRKDRLSDIRAPVAVPEISLDTINRIRSGVSSLSLDIKRLLQRCVELNSGAKTPVADWKEQVEQAEGVTDSAIAMQKQGLPIQCYYDLLQAHALSGILLKESRLVRKRVDADYQAMLVEAISIFGEAESQIESMALALKGQVQAGSLSAKINAINAEILLCEAKSHLYSGREQIVLALKLVGQDPDFIAKPTQFRIGKKTEADVYNVLQHAVQYLAIAETRALAVRDWYSFSRFNEGVRVQVPDEYIQSLASGYSFGAVAAFNYFKETKVKETISVDSLRKAGAPMLSEQQVDGLRDYLYGYWNASFPPLKFAAGLNSPPSEKTDSRILKLWEDAKQDPASTGRDEDPLTAFGFAAYSYTGFAHLLFQMDTFQDRSGQPAAGQGDGGVRLGNRKALARYLDITRDRALRKVELVRVTLGEIPESIITNMNLADVKRYGSKDEERLQAFLGYWRTSLLCDLAMNIHDKFK